jgi:hypothetical protein
MGVQGASDQVRFIGACDCFVKQLNMLTFHLTQSPTGLVTYARSAISVAARAANVLSLETPVPVIHLSQ